MWLTSGEKRLRAKQKLQVAIAPKTKKSQSNQPNNSISRFGRQGQRSRSVEVGTSSTTASIANKPLVKTVNTDMNFAKDLQSDIAQLSETLLQQQAFREEIMRNQAGMTPTLVSNNSEIFSNTAQQLNQEAVLRSLLQQQQQQQQQQRQQQQQQQIGQQNDNRQLLELLAVQEELKFHEQLLLHDELQKTKKKEEEALQEQQMMLNRLSAERLISQFSSSINQLQEAQQRHMMENAAANKLNPDPSVLAAALGVFGQQQQQQGGGGQNRNNDLSLGLMGAGGHNGDSGIGSINGALGQNPLLNQNSIAQGLLANATKGGGGGASRGILPSMHQQQQQANVSALRHALAANSTTNNNNNGIDFSAVQALQENGVNPFNITSGGVNTASSSQGSQGVLSPRHSHLLNEQRRQGGGQDQTPPLLLNNLSGLKRNLLSQQVTSNMSGEDMVAKRIKLDNMVAPTKYVSSSSSTSSSSSEALNNPSLSSGVEAKNIRYFNNGTEVRVDGIPMVNKNLSQDLVHQDDQSTGTKSSTCSSERATKARTKSKKHLIHSKFERNMPEESKTPPTSSSSDDNEDKKEEDVAAKEEVVNNKKKKSTTSGPHSDFMEEVFNRKKDKTVSSSISAASSSALTAASALLGFMKPR